MASSPGVAMNDTVSASLNGQNATGSASSAYYTPSLPQTSGQKLGRKSPERQCEPRNPASEEKSSIDPEESPGNHSVIVIDTPQRNANEIHSQGCEAIAPKVRDKGKGKMRKRKEPEDDEVQILSARGSIRDDFKITRRSRKRQRNANVAVNIIDLTSKCR